MRWKKKVNRKELEALSVELQELNKLSEKMQVQIQEMLSVLGKSMLFEPERWESYSSYCYSVMKQIGMLRYYNNQILQENQKVLDEFSRIESFNLKELLELEKNQNK